MQLDRIATVLLAAGSASSPDGVDMAALSRQALSTAGTAELLRLRAAIARSADAALDSTKLAAIALLPASYLPSESRKSVVRQIVASTTTIDEVALGYLLDVAREDAACARLVRPSCSRPR